MLEIMRQKLQGVIVWIIIIIIGLAFLGLSDFFISRNDSQTAVKVDGVRISAYEIEELVHSLQRQYGDKVDAKTLKDHARIYLAQEVALTNAAKKLGFTVSDQLVAASLMRTPAFQVDGKFSKDRYLQVLQNNGFTDYSYRAKLAKDILNNQLERGLAQSSFVLSQELYRLIELDGQTRDFGYAILPKQKFKTGNDPSKEEIKSYFEANASQFVAPEQVSLQYVQLNLDNLAKEIQIDEAEQKAFYQEHKDSYSAPERAHAKHILIALPPDASEREMETAQTKLQEIQQKIKDGISFSDLAQEYSDDVESGKKGGDLGWFAKGQMVPEFEKTIFAMRAPNSISEPVRSKFGFHIIQLIEHKEAETRPYQEVAPLVKELLQKEKAQTLFIEKGEEMARLAFEQPSSLSPIEKELGLRIEETDFFGKQGGREKMTRAPELLQVAFSDPIIKQGNNSDPIKIGEGNLVVVRLKEYKPSKPQNLTEVENQIKERLINARAAQRLKEASETIAEKLREGEDPLKLAKEKDLKWITKKGIARTSKEKELSPQVLQAAFQTSLPKEGKPSVKLTSLPNGDVLILALSATHDGDITQFDDKTRKEYNQALSLAFGQLEYRIIVEQILGKTKIEIPGNKRQ